MYSLNFVYRSSPFQVTFTFKAFKNFDEFAKKASALLRPATLQEVSLDLAPNDLLAIEDDFGTSAEIHMNDICSVIRIDRDKDMAVQAEMKVAYEKELGKAITKAQQDPALRIMKPVGSPIIQNN